MVDIMKDIYEPEAIPKDDQHRFLRWLPSYDDCLEWADDLKKHNDPHLIEKNANGKWTIYKHMRYGGCDCGEELVETVDLRSRKMIFK